MDDHTKAINSARGHHRAGRAAEAEKIYRQILEERPDHAEALHLLGVLAGQRGDFDRAIEMIGRALGLDPNHAEAYRNLGVLLAQRQRYEEARTALAKAAELRPGDPQTKIELAKVCCVIGRALAKRGLLNEAIAAQSQAIDAKPDFFLAHFGRGHALRGAGRMEEALECYRQSVRLKPDLLEAHVSMAAILGHLHRFEEAMECYARAAAIDPNAAITHEALGGILLQQRGAAAAIVHFRRAVEADPKLLSAWNSLGLALQAHGEFEQATKCFEKMLEIQPDSALARKQLVATSRQRRSDAEIGPLLELLGQEDLSPEQRIAAEFALGTALDDAERYDEAFAHFEAGNSLKKQQRAQMGEKYDAQAFGASVDSRIEAFTPEFFSSRRGWGEESELPVFVVGMPRSGTTLVQQIAASHPQVHGAGELKAIYQIMQQLGGSDGNHSPMLWQRQSLRDFAAAHLRRLASLKGDRLRAIDKMPSNLHQLGLIALLFPSARVVFCRRDPRDTCLSCHFQEFASGHIFSCDLADCGHYQAQNDRLMSHWLRVLPLRMLEVQYEEVVGDLEGQSRRLIDFLGLPWNDACLEFHRTETTVLTSSVWQVRQPIYSRSVGRWRNYARHLAPLLKSLNME